MIPENIQRFNTFAVHLFSLLYEEFPNPCDIGPDHFFEFADEVEGDTVWGAHDDQTVLSTVRWLHDEGYIRVTDYLNSLSLGVRLTQKGLLVLNATPDSLHAGETMGEKIKSALADGSKNMVTKLIEQALDIGIKYAMGKVGNKVQGKTNYEFERRIKYRTRKRIAPCWLANERVNGTDRDRRVRRGYSRRQCDRQVHRHRAHEPARPQHDAVDSKALTTENR